jgi:hypothetical protein
LKHSTTSTKPDLPLRDTTDKSIPVVLIRHVQSQWNKVNPLPAGLIKNKYAWEHRHMKALLITLKTQTIDVIDIISHDDIVKLIGYDTITWDEIGPEGDRLFFDEECFLRGTSCRFQIDTVIPVSGKGVIVGSTDDGTTLRDAVSDVENIRNRIKYL